jgi:hypothetical protein
MPGIILQTNAVDVVNKGGGFPTKTFRKEIFVGPLKRKRVVSQKMVSTKKMPGTDYVVFNCPAPGCGQRNKKSVYEAKAQTADGRLSFKCSHCYREIEVQRPMSQLLSEKDKPQTSSRIVNPGNSGLLVGSDGKPIRGTTNA